MQTTKRKPKPKKVKDYISPEGKKIIAKVLNDFSKRKRKLDMGLVVDNECGTVCCFAGAIMVEKLGAKQAYWAGNYEHTANGILGLQKDSDAAYVFSKVYDSNIWYFTEAEQNIYHSGHRTRALRMAVARTMETEV